MSKVYFIRNTKNDWKRVGAIALDLLKKVAAETDYSFDKEVPIKVHFGEDGNKTFIAAEAFDALIEYLKQNNVDPCYIETNVLYRGSRTTSCDHISTAKKHGFTQIPIVIADGEIGTEYNDVVINKDFFKSCRIGKEYARYRQFIVTSHFKGHMAAGFGGSLKQLAMGFAARSGKMAQHTEIHPIVNPRKCIACGLCVEKCDFQAIQIEKTAVIDPEKCVGCAGCIAVCPESAISNSWQGVNFMEKIAEYAYGATRGKDNIYISFVHNITADCDCMGQSMKPLIGHIGVLAGRDPVALDAACLDLVQQSAGKKLFDSGRAALVHAEKIGLGTAAYELEEISL